MEGADHTNKKKKVKQDAINRFFLKREQKSLMRPSSRCNGRDQSTGDSGQNPQSAAAFREQLQVITRAWSRELGPGARMGECMGVTRKPLHDSNGEQQILTVMGSMILGQSLSLSEPVSGSIK